MKKMICVLILYSISFQLFAQNVQLISAQEILNKVSDLYAKIIDFQSNITITKGETKQRGLLLFNNKYNLLKIEFYSPAEQFLLIDRDKIQIYLPSHQTILEQGFKDSSQSLASSGGLTLLKSNYSISFAEAGLTPLDKNSNEKVYKLACYPIPGSKEGFKYLIISVLPESYLIRRIEAVNFKNEKITFEYTNITINPGIPYTRFSVDPPNLTNVYPNFLSR